MMRRAPIAMAAWVAACMAACMAATLAAWPAARAQGGQPASRSLLRGTVVDDADDRPIAGATVVIEVLRLQAVTDSAGTFRMPYIAAGRHIVLVRRLGFTPLSAVLNFGPSDTLEFDFALIKQPTNLPEVAVRTDAPVPPKLVEFEERRKAGFGRFLTPDFLEKNRDRRLSEVMAVIPGPRIVRGSGNYGWIASSVGSGAIQRRFGLSPMDVARGADPNQCYAAVMLDGNLIYSGRSGEMLFDVNSLATNTVAAIEYYRDAASTPSKFNIRGGETCGLVVIWTK
jgi:hypothetical protein